MPISKARLRISDYTQDRKGKEAEKRKRVLGVSLALTPMVDMFAILVVFLLANIGTIQDWIDLEHNIQLPKAAHADTPVKAGTLQVTKSTVFGDKKKALIEVSKVSSGPLIIPSVRSYLQTLKINSKEDSYINVVGDQELPFGVVRRLVATCQEAGFKNINLAVAPVY